jgi:hypothetical protein
MKKDKLVWNKFKNVWEVEQFEHDWKEACNRLKSSGYNLSVPIVPMSESEKVKYEK